MATYVDFARFEPEDPEPIVAASFACPYCLDLPDVTVVVQSIVSCALVHCEPCRAEWRVHLSRAQVDRLRAAPPPSVGLSRRGWV